MKRFRDQGVPGLVDASRRPRRSPTLTPDAIRNEIIRQKQAHPKWGPKKLRELLARKYGERAPGRKTIDRVLRDVGLINKPRRRRPGRMVVGSRPSVVVDAPNALWTVDFKGWWRTTDGRRCDPLTVRDAFSRYVLAIRVMPMTREEPVRAVFEELFRRYGLPKAIQSDNGTPFASALSLGGLTRLSAWWVDLGVDVVRSRPGCPQDNGGHERMHLDVSVELEGDRASTLEAQQAAFDEWVAEFNHVRPHEALGMRTPAQVYVPSKRRMPTLVLTTYPSHMSVHRVNERGFIEHRGWRVYVSLPLSGRLIAIEEFDDRCDLWFCNLRLGAFVYRRDDRLQPPEPEAPQRASAPVHPGEERSDLPVLPLATAVPRRRRRGPATAAIEEPKKKGEEPNLLPEV
jgi:transposase InsO family protein